LGTGECSARCIGGRLGARGAGVRFGNRPWPAGSAGALGRGAPKAPYPSYWVWVLVPGGGGYRSPGSGGGWLLRLLATRFGGVVDGPATLGGLAG